MWKLFILISFTYLLGLRLKFPELLLLLRQLSVLLGDLILHEKKRLNCLVILESIVEFCVKRKLCKSGLSSSVFASHATVMLAMCICFQGSQ